MKALHQGRDGLRRTFWTHPSQSSWWPFHSEVAFQECNDAGWISQHCAMFSYTPGNTLLSLQKNVSQTLSKLIVGLIFANWQQIAHLLDADQEVLTLGIMWNTTSDHLSIAVNFKPLPLIITKRSFLSDTIKLLDPLGLAAPCTIRTNILMQEISSMLDQYLADTRVRHYFTNSRIPLHFNPPSAPHMGGYWEVGAHKISYQTSVRKCASDVWIVNILLTEGEAWVNSRPLVDHSSQSGDGHPLTPGHFIIGDPLKRLPELPISKFLGSLNQR